MKRFCCLYLLLSLLGHGLQVNLAPVVAPVPAVAPVAARTLPTVEALESPDHAMITAVPELQLTVSAAPDPTDRVLPRTAGSCLLRRYSRFCAFRI